MKKGLFSKLIVAGVITANVIFTFAVLLIFLKVHTEPSTLIVSWFGFTATEMLGLASIKRTKEKNTRGGDSDG